MIIGISGKKQCGKDTVCKIIQAIDCYKRIYTDIPIEQWIEEKLQRFSLSNCSTWKRHSFADKLKQMASVLTGFPDVSFWESGKIKDMINTTYGITNREILQTLGQSLRENLSQDIWIKALFTSYSPTESKWIISDVRMPNEAEAIKERKGILIRVNRNTEYNDNHISEIALDDYDKFDYVVDNNENLKSLIIKIIEIYDRIGTA